MVKAAKAPKTDVVTRYVVRRRGGEGREERREGRGGG
jgi:hypothetical protein